MNKTLVSNIMMTNISNAKMGDAYKTTKEIKSLIPLRRLLEKLN